MGRCRINNLIVAAEPVSNLEGDIIAGFLNVKPPSNARIVKLLREGKYGEIADLMAEVWAAQFGRVLTTALETQVQRAGDSAARELGDLMDVDVSLSAEIEIDSRLQFARPPIPNPRVLEWVGGRTSALLGTLGDDAREVINSAITRGATEQLTDRQVARVISQHIGLDARRSTAVENYRKFVYDFRARKDIERVIRKRPRTVKERLQRGGFVRKEWRIIREHGVQKALPDRRLDNMVAEYASRLKKERALTIARHEIAMAQNRAKELVWEKAQVDGTMLPSARRKWITRKDGLVCKFCGPMHGKLAPVGGVWHTARGEVKTPNEIHTTCRCGEKLIARPAQPAWMRKATRQVSKMKESSIVP